MVRILLADDSQLVRSGLQHILDDTDDLRVVKAMSVNNDILQAVDEEQVEILLLDVPLPGGYSLALIKKLLRKNIKLKIVALMGQTHTALAANLLKLGVLSLLHKDCSAREVLDAIHCVKMGKCYLCQKIAQALAESSLEGKSEEPFAALSQRELQIVLLIIANQDTASIAEQLNLSPKTINSHRYRIFSKLDVHTDVELMHLALRNGLLDESR